VRRMKRAIACLLVCIIGLSGCESRQTEQTMSTQTNEEHADVSQLSKKQEISASNNPAPTLDQLPTPDSNSASFSNSTLIVSIGDSLTKGIGDATNQGGYLPYLEKKLENEPAIHAVEMVNHGVKGNRSNQLVKQLNKKEIRKDIERADSVVVTIGGNDIMKVFKQHFTHLQMEQFHSAKREYEVALGEILDKIRAYNQSAQIYLVGLYNPFSNPYDELYELDVIVSDWNKSGEKIIEKYDSAYFIKIEDIFSNATEDILYTEDLFHPNNHGYELIANRIYNNMDLSTMGEETIEASAKGDED
jgi:lysophospholipase L1-like esterase